MDISIEPTIYQPGINFSGDYIDNIPNFKFNTAGIICPCSNKDKVFINRQSFIGHTKTKKHSLWLDTINNNKSNYLVDNISLKETIKTQKIIIARYEKQIRDLNKQIEHLTPKYDPGIDLLGLNELDF
tara:strand:- start:840 stop:1223 length:384 start_codon:yes stop_codon:yes gene_type:complete